MQELLEALTLSMPLLLITGGWIFFRKKRKDKEYFEDLRSFDNKREAEYRFQDTAESVYRKRYLNGFDNPDMGYTDYIRGSEPLIGNPEAFKEYWILVEQHLGKTEQELRDESNY